MVVHLVKVLQKDSCFNSYVVLLHLFSRSQVLGIVLPHAWFLGDGGTYKSSWCTEYERVGTFFCCLRSNEYLLRDLTHSDNVRYRWLKTKEVQKIYNTHRGSPVARGVKILKTVEPPLHGGPSSESLTKG